MRMIEWETKGVSRTPNPSTATTREWPSPGVDNRPYREAGGPMPGKTPPDGSEDRRETKP
jgi:hypothetical protein